MRPERNVEWHEITCAHCGRKVEAPKLKTRKYCSYDCYYESKREREIENQHKDFKFDEFCKGCGNVIKKYGNYRACSKVCLAKIRKRQHLEAAPKKCLNCKTVIKTNKKYLYCSTECQREHYAKEAWLERKKRNNEPMNCSECKTELTYRRRVRFCSTECRETAQKTEYEAELERKTKICKRCDNALENRRHLYCSDKCKILYNASRQMALVAREKRYEKENKEGQDSLNEYFAKNQT